MDGRGTQDTLIPTPGDGWALAADTPVPRLTEFRGKRMNRLCFALALACVAAAPFAPTPGPYAEIRVLDAVTRRGVPLVELETVNGLRFVTDNAGRVAFHEPGLMGREVYFSVRGHGYRAKKDGFGFAGVRLVPRAGRVAVVEVTRTTPAERLCRLTGEGTYRDTILLGRTPPLADSPRPGRVAGQDSVQAAVRRGKVYCFWGDTLRMNYPLGLYRTAGATFDATADVAAGIAYDYFTDAKTGFARAMMPLAARPEGVVWINGLCAVKDRRGDERLVCHYSRRKGLADELEQGIAAFDDAKAVFEPVARLPLTEAWRRPVGHPVVHEGWLYFGDPTPNVRVPATYEAVLDAKRYEAFTCARAGDEGGPDLGRDGAPNWRWQKELPPTDSPAERKWVRAGKLKAERTRFLPEGDGERVTLHRGSVRWNAHRKRWVLIANQVGGKSSHLGEVWYAEADAPTGPFAKAVKVLTHDRQTFYNPVHHDFLDRDAGRFIHFEGTYTRDFSGNPDKTPRYDYNQVLYRLDLDAPGLKAAK